ncbi:UNVERIFIED_CONTAM: hypothetical protein PYX00_002277 [Menopon gallinae]|uniref:PLD phosphodiesterase domain-containing protein n=1 Tax=Menopon gallinae TaxID=328185 RepID=A0AAW2IH50_9NEOP
MVSVTANTNTKKDVHLANQPRSNRPFASLYWQRQAEGQSKFHIGLFVSILLLTALASMVLFIPLMYNYNMLAFYTINNKDVPCGNSCRIEIVETIPEGLVYNETLNHLDTFNLWKNLIWNANSSIDIASFYWTMRENETYAHPSSKKGEEIYQALLNAGLRRNITIRIAQNEPTTFQKNPDTEYLAQIKAAEVRSLNFTKLVGAGVLHTKFWIIDKKHVYIGSANMDWRALTHVKELGVAIHDCPCIAADLGKVFDVYWALGESNEVPSKWPEKYSTRYNANNPLNVSFSDKTNLVYISSAPPSFSPKGRTHDIDALLRTIINAKQFIYISVMDYFPLNLYTHRYKFWPIIDNEIRRAVIERGVNVKILISHWRSTRPMIFKFMNSLRSLDRVNGKVRVETKKFKVLSTPDQDKIPFARVNHNKYMVTDNGVFIGTSNWSADYFTDTAGVSFVMTTNSTLDNTLREQLVEVFNRDWNSSYAQNIY